MMTAKLLLVYLLQTASTLGINADISNINIEEAYCLAENIYYEARNEDIQGQYAVASVTINRSKDNRFPDTICEVVKQTAVSRATKNVVCAFSWYCENDRKGKDIPFRNRDGSMNQPIVDQFQVAVIVAITTLSGVVEDNTGGATHFHNPRKSNPDWARKLKHTVKIGNHTFHK
ncbi:MAG TPA: cell wall hydrolase [Ignavibacteriaceae bacterium]